jgi:hypothetical protein
MERQQKTKFIITYKKNFDFSQFETTQAKNDRNLQAIMTKISTLDHGQYSGDSDTSYASFQHLETSSSGATTINCLNSQQIASITKKIQKKSFPLLKSDVAIGQLTPMLHNARRRGNIRDIADSRTVQSKKTAPIISAENIKDLDSKFKESFRKEAIDTKDSSKIIVQKANAEPMAIANY